MSPDSGRATATTTTATHGSSSAIRATDLAGRARPRADRRDAALPDHRLRCSRLAGTSSRTARRRAAHGRGRLPGAAQRLDDGEVSPYLTDELRAGDEIELRGPIGGYFVWEESLGGPLVLVAGGSGVVPMRSILRHWAAGERAVPVWLVYSARSLSEVIYRVEL